MLCYAMISIDNPYIQSCEIELTELWIVHNRKFGIFFSQLVNSVAVAGAVANLYISYKLYINLHKSMILIKPF